MPAELRARRSRPSYKIMFELPGDEEGGPSIPQEDASSDSAFEPQVAEEERDGVGEDEDDLPGFDQDEDPIPDDESDIAFATAGPSKGKGKGKGKAKASGPHTTATLHRPATVMLAPGLSRPNARQFYALPVPSLNHRHRGIPIYLPPSRVLRLVHEPRVFGHVETTFTRSIADTSVGERVTRAMGNSFGKGPVWELMEDRSWFRECASDDQTRPIVYPILQVKEGWELLSAVEASPYLPRNSDGSGPSPPLTCYFGPYGSQAKLQLNTFQTYKIADFFPESKAHVFYAGAPVWAIDWCPISVDTLPHRDFKQYIAVAPFPSQSHSPEIGRRVSRPSQACIQIWSLSPTRPIQDGSAPKKKKKGETEDAGVMSCDLVLCLDGGPAHDIKWCPLPAHDAESSTSVPRKLGILGGTFEDGSLSFYVVPDPRSLTRSDQLTSGPLYVKLEPHLRIELDDTLCWSLDWANSDLVATGCTNGSLAIFRVKEALAKPSHERLRPSHYIALHQSAVRSVSWVRVPPTSGSGAVRPDRDPTVLVSGGYDGAQMVTDIRDHRGNVMNRTRDVINSIVYSQHCGGPVVSDHENTIKNFGLAPAMLGRGHALLEPSGPVWSISSSDFHSQIAVGSADGACQTTNMTKSTRRGGAVPFFIYKIFQMDYSRISQEYKMLENLLPHEHQDRPAAARVTKKKQGAAAETTAAPTSTGAWSPEVSVTRVIWQSGSGLARAPLLASATASGLCRIDWLLGRFAHRFPYKNIETLRGEVGGAEDEEMEDD